MVSRAIRRNRAGFDDGNRPIGSFLFVGPTGVGKTELAKQLAIDLFGNKDALIRLDMVNIVTQQLFQNDWYNCWLCRL